MYTGPHIIKDSLVFGYDTGYGVADNTTGTRHYKGKPTENLLALAGADTDLERSGAAPSYSYHSVNITSYVQSRWTSGNNVLVQSFEGKREYVGGGTGGGNDGYPRMYVYFSDWSWSSSFGISTYDWSYGRQIFTMPNPAGKTVYMTIYHMNSQNPGRSYSRKQSVSFNTIDIPYIKGSRSSTQSLIDLTKSTNIDVSNVSFDSTGQPTFDGTDDSLTITGSSYITSDVKTIEIAFKMNGSYSNTSPLAVYANGSSSTNRIWLGLESSKFKMHGWGTDDPSGTTTISADEWYICTFSYNKSTQAMKMYTNGVLESSITNSQGGVTAASNMNWYIGTIPGGYQGVSYSDVDIPIFKVYNKVLSDLEVKQNFNSYKNRFGI
jgi:hypothetical protein